MAFWCNDSKTYSLMRRVTPFHRFLAWFLFAVLPFLGFLVLSYLPQNKQIAELKKEYEILLNQENEARVVLEKLVVLKNENIRILNQFKSDFLNLDSSEFVADLIQNNKLSCSDIKPIKIQQSNLVRKNYFSAVLKGSFRNCVDFFQNLQDDSKLIKICALKICKWKKRRIRCELAFRDVSIIV